MSNEYSYCSSLVSIEIPNSVTILEPYAFFCCRSLKEVTISNKITKIEQSVFEYCGIEGITIPSSVTEIGEYAFGNCEKLTEITIPNTVRKIGEHAFNGCENLANVTIGSGIEEIGYGAFFNTPLKECRIYATVPPLVVFNNGFSSTTYGESTLYVPKGCVQTYIDAGWGKYFYNIVEMSE